MFQFVDRIENDLTPTKLNTYWLGFEMVAYAIYDKNTVHIFNHPKFENSYVKKKNGVFYLFTQ
ncbi:hypothetical protein [Robertmurraya kyonggiensis]|uniref:Uncharacterized protein n=1 Tax=Robertmurraya kyonggiensis TaxID=1037680 RepID=A0A4U1D8R5_9BACI|nr:hypothetical protein [Robertmurraya kyonggiensis]TKC18945.1 hypothetical protein FA727_05195 [Robertmurraya kyonggiensis]